MTAAKSSRQTPRQAATGRQAETALRIGWAARGFTPTRPAMLQGQMNCRVARTAMDPLTVTAMAVEGAAAIVTCPFELFLDYSMRIKARRPAAHTLVLQLAGGLGWYLPTAKALQGGGYGAMPAVCAVGPEGGGLFVEDTLTAIRTLFPA